MTPATDRETVGYTLADAAGLLAGYGADDDLRDVLTAISGPCRASGWWAGYRSLFTGDHLGFLAAESAARAILAYAHVQIPALLHSTAYARAAAAPEPGVAPDAAETVVQAAYARQRAVLREQDTRVTVVIGEAALRQRAGDAAMMRAQYRRLVTLAAAAPKITLHVLPFTAGPLAAGGAGGFTILQSGQPPAPGLVQLTGPNGGTFLDAPQAVAAYLEVFTCLRRSALTVRDSAYWLGRLAGG